MKNRDVASEWVAGRSAEGSHMYTDGTTIWSYGEHFPMAWRGRGRVYLNTDRYSNSTSQHQASVRNAMIDLPAHTPVRKVDTAAMRRIVESGGAKLPREQWRRSNLYKQLVAALAEQGVEVVDPDHVKYGELVTTAVWDYDPRGNLTMYSDFKYETWLHGRASKPKINKKEPVFVRVDVAVLLKA